jgi:hypothetical protein
MRQAHSLSDDVLVNDASSILCVSNTTKLQHSIIDLRVVRARDQLERTIDPDDHP